MLERFTELHKAVKQEEYKNREKKRKSGERALPGPESRHFVGIGKSKKGGGLLTGWVVAGWVVAGWGVVAGTPPRNNEADFIEKRKV